MTNELILLAAAIATVVGGGALLTFRFTKQKSKSSNNTVTIRDVHTMGDVAGRDINKK